MGREWPSDLKAARRVDPGPAVLVPYLNTELGEGSVDQPEPARRAVADRDLAARYSRQGEEGGDLMMVFVKAVRHALETAGLALDGQPAAGFAGDVRAQGEEKSRKLLDVRLGGCVDQN